MEPEELEWKTRKPMTMYGSKHYKTDVDRLYLQRCEGGGGLIGLKDCVHVEAPKYFEGEDIKLEQNY